MILFILYFFFIFFFLEIVEVTNLMILKDYYITIFFIFFTINYIFVNTDSTNNFEKINCDLLFKYCHIFLKSPAFFLNYIANMIKKLLLYLFGFKYYNYYIMWKLYMLQYSYLFVFWKPLFKKTSYFGYFRSNRSKWIK